MGELHAVKPPWVLPQYLVLCGTERDGDEHSPVSPQGQPRSLRSGAERPSGLGMDRVHRHTEAALGNGAGGDLGEMCLSSVRELKLIQKSFLGAFQESVCL